MRWKLTGAHKEGRIAFPRAEALSSFTALPGSPGQHVSQAGRSEQRRDVSRED
jgi:hypothetical protein